MTNFTMDELNLMLQFLDLATKAQGLQVATQALSLAHKINAMKQEMAATVETVEG